MSRLVPLLALGSALFTAGGAIFVRQGLRGADAYSGYWINLAVGTVCLWAVVLVTGPHGAVSFAGIAFFALAGLVGTLAGRLLRFVAIEKVGASVSSALINLSPLVASVLAILLLGERVTLPIVLGTLVIILGTVSVVTPLTGSAPIFVLLLSFLFLRDVETLTGRIVAGTILIVLGVYLITAL